MKNIGSLRLVALFAPLLASAASTAAVVARRKVKNEWPGPGGRSEPARKTMPQQTRAGVHRAPGLVRIGTSLHLIAFFALLLILGAGGAVAIWPSVPPAQVSVAGATSELPPDTPVRIALPRLGVSLAELSLTEAVRDAEGNVLSKRSLPVGLAPNGGSGFWSEAQLQRTDGSPLMAYDSLYRLHLAVSRWEPAFPLPREVVVARDYSFSTLTTPRLEPVQGVVELRCQQPVELRWTAPVEQFAVQVLPEIETRTWFDPRRRDVAYVELVGTQLGTQYQVRVTSARGLNGAPMLSPAGVAVLTAAAPKPIPDSLALEGGRQIVLRWDRPLQTLDYQIEPTVDSSATVDPADPRTVAITLRNPKQQQEYRLGIVGGLGTSGAPITERQEFTVVTPAPLEIAAVSPRDGAFGMCRDTPIDITFTDSIEDRAAAERAITLEPAIPGRFQWPGSDRVKYVPEGELPPEADVVVRVQGGESGVRAANGAYLAESFEFTFLTRPNKLIDVDLRQQRLVLLEGETPVYAAAVATGVRGAETPTGEYMVLYKLPTTRMKGVNPSGSRYDIPDVPWVMAFQGDYTLHGAPWRSQFGSPMSNGCVSMSTADARIVYDWSPLGTPIRIHY